MPKLSSAHNFCFKVFCFNPDKSGNYTGQIVVPYALIPVVVYNIKLVARDSFILYEGFDLFFKPFRLVTLTISKDYNRCNLTFMHCIKSHLFFPCAAPTIHGWVFHICVARVLSADYSNFFLVTPTLCYSPNGGTAVRHGR